MGRAIGNACPDGAVRGRPLETGLVAFDNDAIGPVRGVPGRLARRRAGRVAELSLDRSPIPGPDGGVPRAGRLAQEDDPPG